MSIGYKTSWVTTTTGSGAPSGGAVGTEVPNDKRGRYTMVALVKTGSTSHALYGYTGAAWHRLDGAAVTLSNGENESEWYEGVAGYDRLYVRITAGSVTSAQIGFTEAV